MTETAGELDETTRRMLNHIYSRSHAIGGISSEVLFFLVIVLLGYFNGFIPPPYNVFHMRSEYIFWFIALNISACFLAFMIWIMRDEESSAISNIMIAQFILFVLAGIIVIGMGYQHVTGLIIFNTTLFVLTPVSIAIGYYKFSMFLYYRWGVPIYSQAKQNRSTARSEQTKTSGANRSADPYKPHTIEEHWDTPTESVGSSPDKGGQENVKTSQADQNYTPNYLRDAVSHSNEKNTSSKAPSTQNDIEKSQDNLFNATNSLQGAKDYSKNKKSTTQKTSSTPAQQETMHTETTPGSASKREDSTEQGTDGEQTSRPTNTAYPDTGSKSSKTDIGIVGLPGSGKTVFLSILDLYLSEKGRKMGIKYELKGNPKRIQSNRSSILNGSFPEATPEGARDNYSIKLSSRQNRQPISSTITDIPGEDVMGKNILEYEASEFSNILKQNNLGFLLSCKSFIFIVPARLFVPQESGTFSQNPTVFSYSYRDFFLSLIGAISGGYGRSSRSVSRILKGGSPTPVLVIVSQWDVARWISPEMTAEIFVRVKMAEFYNSLKDEEDAGKISLSIVGTGIESVKTENSSEFAAFRPDLGKNLRPHYIGIDEVVTWIISEGKGVVK